MAVDLSQFHASFFEESYERLEEMESALLELGRGVRDMEIVNAAFRAAHSIKGGAGTFGFTNVTDFTHVLETLLDEVREERREPEHRIVELMLRSVDCLRGVIDELKDGSDAVPGDYSELIKALEACLDDAADATGPSAPGSEQTTCSGGGWEITFRPHPHFQSTGNDALRLIRELRALGESSVDLHTEDLPPFASLDPNELHLRWTIRLEGEVSQDEIRELFEWVEDDCDLEITPLADQDPAPEPEPSKASSSKPTVADDGAQSNAKEGRKKAAENASIRVSTEKVDALINLVGELVITQSMLGSLGRGEIHATDEQLTAGLDLLEQNTRELQDAVMRIRMMPIGFLFSRFPRLVHDISSKLGKDIELVLEGEQTELDKTMLEQLSDPLVHLVRNSMDHGIEMPDVREASGKEPRGRLTLSARHQGGAIIIEIRDDGAGIDADRIREKAIEKGVIGANAQLDHRETLELIFHPGFSTAAEVTDLSGRGVGMDVVRRNIAALGGAIDLRSEKGKGTTIEIRLPLTLAILDGQIIRVGDQTYVVPLTSIVESLQIDSERIRTVAGTQRVYDLRAEYVPMVWLDATFNSFTRNEDAIANRLMVVVEANGDRIGLVVDDLLEQQQVVVKSLEANYRRIDGFSGATILGDGRVALILDTSGLARLGRTRSNPAEVVTA